MVNMEKVIKGLERCKEGGSCDGCQYDIQSSKCIFLLHADALVLLKEQQEQIDKLLEESASNAEMAEGMNELLKEQEAVVHPEPSCEMTYITNCCCDLCGVQLIREDNFCRCCGKRIEWEGR